VYSNDQPLAAANWAASVTCLLFQLTLCRTTVGQFYNRRDQREGGASSGTVHRVWSISGRRAARCYGQPAMQWRRPTAGQIRYRTTEYHLFPEHLWSECLRQRYMRTRRYIAKIFRFRLKKKHTKTKSAISHKWLNISSWNFLRLFTSLFCILHSNSVIFCWAVLMVRGTYEQLRCCL